MFRSAYISIQHHLQSFHVKPMLFAPRSTSQWIQPRRSRNSKLESGCRRHVVVPTSRFNSISRHNTFEIQSEFWPVCAPTIPTQVSHKYIINLALKTEPRVKKNKTYDLCLPPLLHFRSKKMTPKHENSS